MSSEAGGLLCAGCKQYKPREEYSSKQFKLKGKRRCMNCVNPPAPNDDSKVDVKTKVYLLYLFIFLSLSLSLSRVVLFNSVWTAIHEYYVHVIGQVSAT